MNELLEEVANHPKHASHGEECGVLLRKVKRALAGSSSSSSGDLLELLDMVLREEFCSMMEENVWGGFKALSLCIARLCSATTGADQLKVLGRNVTLMAGMLAAREENQRELGAIAKDLVLLAEQLVATNHSPLPCFPNSAKITLKQLECNSQNDRTAILCGCGFGLGALAKVPEVLYGGSLNVLARGLRVFCDELDRGSIAVLEPALELASVLPGNARYGFLEALLASITADGALEAWPAEHLRQVASAIASTIDGLDVALLAVHCSSHVLALLEKLVDLPGVDATASLEQVVLQLVTKFIDHSFEFCQAALQVRVFHSNSSFVTRHHRACHTGLVQVWRAVFRARPDLLDWALRGKKNVDDAAKPKENEWIDFLTQSTSFCGKLLRTELFAEMEGGGKLFEQCLKELSESNNDDDDKLVCLLACTTRSFKHRQLELWERASGKLQGLFQRTHPPTLRLLELLRDMKPASVTGSFLLPSGDSLLPIETYIHADGGDLGSTLRCLGRATDLLLGNHNASRCETARHLLRIVNQVPSTSGLANSDWLLDRWIGMAFGSGELELEARLVMVDAVAAVLAGAIAPNSLAKQQMARFLQQGLVVDDAHISSRVAAHFGVLLKFDVPQPGRVERDQVREFMSALTLQLGDANLRHKQRQVLTAIGSLGAATLVPKEYLVAATPPEFATSVGVLNYAITQLASRWTQRANAGVVDLITAGEELRRIARAYSCTVPALFDLVGRTLLPPLIAEMLTGPDPKRHLDKFALDVFQDDSRDRSASTLNRFLVVLLPFYLSSPPQKADYAPALKQLARMCTDPTVGSNSDREEEDLLARLLFSNVKLWVVQYVEALTSGKAGRAVFEASGRQLPVYLKGGEKHVLEVYVHKLVLETNEVNPKATRVLELLASECHGAGEDGNSVHHLVRNNFMFMFYQLSEPIQSRSSSTLLNTKRQALRCISRVLVLLWDTPLAQAQLADDFAHRVLSVLADALLDVELQLGACETLKQFADRLPKDAVEANLLGFLVSLLPCFEEKTFANVAVDLVLWLLAKHDFTLSTLSSVQDLLPESYPCLDRVARVLDTKVPKRSPIERVEQLSTLIDHDSDGLCLLALTKLESVLEQHSDEMAFLVQDSAHQRVFSTLFQCLLKVARSVGSRIPQQQHQDASPPSKKTKVICLKCCHCIGLLGAVDPARLRMAPTKHESSAGMDLDNRSLALALLDSFLIDALNTAPDSDTHMKVGLVIQGIVQFLGEGDIPPQLASKVRVFLKTNYELSDSAPEASQFEETLFHKSGSFASSIVKWVTHLCNKSKLEQRKLFVSMGVLKDSSCATRIMLFLLPYAVQNVLCTCEDEEMGSITREVRGILTRASSTEVGDGRDQFSVQAVFLLLETLEKWTSARPANKHYQGEFPNKERIATFLRGIQKIDLAQAAFRIGSLSRAHFYLEAHLRGKYAPHPWGGGVGGPGSWLRDEPLVFAAKDVEFLHKICAVSGEQDPDLLKGVIALRTRQGGEPTLLEQIRELESDAKWSEALKCYEEAIEANNDTLVLHEGQLCCLWRAGNWDLVVNAAEGKMARNPALSSLVMPYALDALWRLGKWPQLRLMLQTSGLGGDKGKRGAPGGVSGAYTESLSRALLIAREGGDFRPQLESAQLEILGLLSAASMESYERAYPLITRLQSLVELERGLGSRWSEEWLRGRLAITSSDASLRGELLAVRQSVRCITSQPLGQMETENWLSLAKMARKLGDYTACESALSVLRRTLQASSSSPDVSVHGELKQTNLLHVKIQRAKLFMAKKDLPSALQALEPCNDFMLSPNNHKATATAAAATPLAKFRGKALLLHTKILIASNSLQGKPVLDRFAMVSAWDPGSQKAKLQLAKYRDYIMERTHGDLTQSSPLLSEVLRAYGQCLLAGPTQYFEVLPRILTLWFTNAEKDRTHAAKLLANNNNNNSTEASAGSNKKPKLTPPKPATAATTTTTHAGLHFSSADCVIRELKDSVPIQIWYTALAQLVSNICTPNECVWYLTKQILVKILGHYPAKALWSVVGVKMSKQENRRRRATELLSTFCETGAYIPRRSHSTNSGSSGGGVYPSSAEAAASGLFRLSKTTANWYLQYSEAVFSAFIALANDKTDSCVKPLSFFQHVQQSSAEQFGLALPTLSCLREDEANPVVFKSVTNKLEVIQSKERPKKIQLVGNNGQTYNFLCKREDRGDLRKDARLMEFISVVNALFTRDVQAERRGLGARTYNVVCLDESCGLLEWVEGTVGFKSQVNLLYGTAEYANKARRNLEMIQNKFPITDDATSRQVLRQKYVEEVLVHTPPRFHKWFLDHFPDPSMWLAAKTEFTKTSAVWSMMGYVLGLGDRHAENLLLHVGTGAVVHVDFDCLFDKGLNLKKPEIVPFRLTRNMVDAMGVCGVEGVFRGTCEITLRVLRGNQDMLLSVLESFVVDPLVEWTRRSPTSSESHETNHEAKKIVSSVAERLAGQTRDREWQCGAANSSNSKLHRTAKGDFNSMSFEALPLSCAGQVDRLILEAIDEEKLCQMFCGWCPFL